MKTVEERLEGLKETVADQKNKITFFILSPLQVTLNSLNKL